MLLYVAIDGIYIYNETVSGPIPPTVSKKKPIVLVEKTTLKF